MGITSIFKLKEKSYYEKWRNTIQKFCKINKYWQYILAQIPQLITSPKKKLILVLKETYNVKLMK